MHQCITLTGNAKHLSPTCISKLSKYQQVYINVVTYPCPPLLTEKPSNQHNYLRFIETPCLYFLFEQTNMFIIISLGNMVFSTYQHTCNLFMSKRCHKSTLSLPTFLQNKNISIGSAAHKFSDTVVLLLPIFNQSLFTWRFKHLKIKTPVLFN